MLKLVLGCRACPESYDAFDGNKQVGYLRLRHGNFTVECPDVGGDLVYTACPEGDGCFMKEERDYYLKFAVDAIQKWQNGLFEKNLVAPDVEYEVEGNPDEEWF